MNLKEAITIRGRQLSGWHIHPVVAERAIEVIKQLARPTDDDKQVALLEVAIKEKTAWTRTK